MTGASGEASGGHITMPWDGGVAARGLEALRVAVASALADPRLRPAAAGGPLGSPGPAGLPAGLPAGVLLTEAITHGSDAAGDPQGYGDADLATSSEEDEAERTRLIALVELARKGDSEAFGLLFDHYQGSVYRFLYYRTRSVTVAEDLTSETFFRALRS